MGKGAKLIFGAATLIPALYFSALFLIPLGRVFSVDPMSSEAPGWVLYFTAFHFLMYLYTGFLLAFYVINLFGRGEIGREKKLLWTLALIAGTSL